MKDDKKHTPHPDDPHNDHHDDDKKKKKKKKRGKGGLIIFLLIIIIILIALIVFGKGGLFGGGDGNGSGDNAKDNSSYSSQNSSNESSSDFVSDVTEIRIDISDIYFGDEKCTDVEDLKNKIVNAGSGKKYTLNHETAIEETYNEVRKVLTELKEADLGIDFSE